MHKKYSTQQIALYKVYSPASGSQYRGKFLIENFHFCCQLDLMLMPHLKKKIVLACKIKIWQKKKIFFLVDITLENTENSAEKRLFRKSTLHWKTIIYVIILQCIPEDSIVNQWVWNDTRHSQVILLMMWDL